MRFVKSGDGWSQFNGGISDYVGPSIVERIDMSGLDDDVLSSAIMAAAENVSGKFESRSGAAVTGRVLRHWWAARSRTDCY
jgi:hypothetical protein